MPAVICVILQHVDLRVQGERPDVVERKLERHDQAAFHGAISDADGRGRRLQIGIEGGAETAGTVSDNAGFHSQIHIYESRHIYPLSSSAICCIYMTERRDVL